MSGDRAAIKYVTRGTHRGPLATPNGVLEPTGKQIEVHGAEFFTFEGGKLVELITLDDVAALMAQLEG